MYLVAVWHGFNPLTPEQSLPTPKQPTLFDITQVFSRFRDQHELADSDAQKSAFT